MLSRRSLIRHAGTLTASAVIGASLGGQARASDSPTATTTTRDPDFRVAHLTDMHVMPDGALLVNAQAGFIRALEHAQGQPRQPDLILQGGDAIMDALRQGKADVTAQWAAFNAALQQHLRTQIRHAIGNHDCWTGPDSDGDALYGKAWAMKELKLERPYYSFDAGGWHFIVLDSTDLTVKDAHGYTAKLDEAQFRWLEADLRETPASKPVLVLSHIPILAVCAYLDGDNELSGNWNVPGAWMHIDARRLKTLFSAHSNIKLCLSGHVHLRDSAVYNGVTYACNGAVCGNWWRGAYQETQPGYALVDLWNDGSFRIEYVRYDP